jgi:hypothetical protein
MSTSAATARLTQAHLAAQLGIRASVLRDILRLMPLWNPFEPGSLEAFSAAVTLLAQQRSLDSAALAARYFQMFREVDLNLTAGKAIALAEPPSVAQVTNAIRSTAVASFWRGLGNGLGPDEAKILARDALSGSMGRLAMQGGRETLLGGIYEDRSYRGRFMRVSDGNPCGFCAMLVSRGPVYLSEDKAGAGRKFHDHCGCSIQPYSGGEWPAENRQMNDAWNAMKSQGGSDVNDFRRFLESKPIGEEVPRASQPSKPKAQPAKPPTVSVKDANQLLKEKQRAEAVAEWRRQQGK